MKLRSLALTFCLAIMPSVVTAEVLSVSYENIASRLSGEIPKVGEIAPVTLVTARDFSRIPIGGAGEKIQVIATVPSVDTPVCSREIHTFDTAIKELDHVHMTVVSMDLPFGGQRFCRGYRINNIDVTSDFAMHEVGKKYGVEIAEGKLQGLLARSVFILDRSGKIVYSEVVPRIEDEPHYDKILELLRSMK